MAESGGQYHILILIADGQVGHREGPALMDMQLQQNELPKLSISSVHTQVIGTQEAETINAIIAAR